LAELKNKDSLDVIQSKIQGLEKNDAVIPITIYKPKNAENLPVFIWFHGGGFILGHQNGITSVAPIMLLKVGPWSSM
jgi:carboxylesterase type B